MPEAAWYDCSKSTRALLLYQFYCNQN